MTTSHPPSRELGILAARGFRAAGTTAGLKASGDPDLSLVVAERAVPASAVFTTSLTPAPPVELDRERISSGRARAVIVNSGVANAATGPAGRKDAELMGAAVAAALGCDDGHVLVCSTGVIGPRLPLDPITRAVPGLVSALGTGPEADLSAARGIMTTDSLPKRSSVSTPAGWSVGGMAKGAGMLRPDMATMLAFLTTDADVDPTILRGVLGEAVASTFNCLNVDGCQSTNDTVVLMASGASGVTPDVEDFEAALRSVCGDLARQMAEDAEGASKVVDIAVSGAESDASARRIGLQIADSALVRSAFYGADPNWGRVLAAAGVAGEPIDQSRIRIDFEGVTVCRDGTGVAVDEEELSARLSGNFSVSVVVGDGPGSCGIVTTDLTPDYVRFNGERS